MNINIELKSGAAKATRAATVLTILLKETFIKLNSSALTVLL